jgi:hypothetical protein
METQEHHYISDYQARKAYGTIISKKRIDVQVIVIWYGGCAGAITVPLVGDLSR